MGILRLLFDFRGRIDRAHYWTGLAIVYVTGPLILAAAALTAVGSFTSSGEEFTPEHAVFGFIGGLLLIFIVSTVASICTMALAAKRLHDINVTGLWCLGIFFAPSPLGTLSTYAAMQMGHNAAHIPWFSPSYLMLSFGAAIIAAVSLLGCLPTTPGPNQYDYPPSPKPYEPTPTHSTPQPSESMQARVNTTHTTFGRKAAS